MLERYHYRTSSVWEPLVGYARSVKVGNVIYVSGTTAANPDGTVVGDNDPYVQTREILQRIGHALHACGGQLCDVVRTRIYVTDISQWELMGKAHGEVFGHILPATTMVEVSSLIAPHLLVEIEAEAVIT